jgi:hypothetical protein
VKAQWVLSKGRATSVRLHARSYASKRTVANVGFVCIHESARQHNQGHSTTDDRLKGDNQCSSKSNEQRLNGVGQYQFVGTEPHTQQQANAPTQLLRAESSKTLHLTQPGTSKTTIQSKKKLKSFRFSQRIEGSRANQSPNLARRETRALVNGETT